MATTTTSIISHFPSPQDGFTTTLSGSINASATTVGLNSVAGYTNGQTAVFVVDPSDPTKKQTFTGVIDTAGIQVTSVVWTAGANVAHAAGATVVDYATATHIGMMTKGLLVHADQDGTLAAGAVDNAAVLASNVVTTAKILDSNVTTAKILDSNVTTAKIAALAITAPKIASLAVDTTAISNPYKFSVYRSTSQSVSGATKILWNTEDYDTNNNFTGSTYTVPVTGFYAFTAKGDITNAGGLQQRMFMSLYKNGSEIRRGDDTTAAGTSNIPVTSNLTAFVSLTAGDTIDVYCFTSGGLTFTAGSVANYFMGYLISQT